MRVVHFYYKRATGTGLCAVSDQHTTFSEQDVSETDFIYVHYIQPLFSIVSVIRR